ncbi:MAG: glycosyltransferase family 2 protein [Candidatus Bathyarchaeia archaeon]
MIGLYSKRLELSIVLPMYNEARRIERCVKEVEEAVKSFSSSYEIIIAEDGSTDGTDLIASHLERVNPNVKHLHSDARLGRGRAIKRALHITRGDVIVYLDADLATNLRHLPQIVKAVKEGRGMAMGSRLVKGSRVERSALRMMTSIAYNLLVRTLFRDGVHDHQCGFKAFSQELAKDLLNRVKSDGWLWDTEMIVRGKRGGYSITEIGVNWTEPRGKRESKVRLFHDAWTMGAGLLRLWQEVNVKKNGRSGKSKHPLFISFSYKIYIENCL